MLYGLNSVSKVFDTSENLMGVFCYFFFFFSAFCSRFLWFSFYIQKQVYTDSDEYITTVIPESSLPYALHPRQYEMGDQ